MNVVQRKEKWSKHEKNTLDVLFVIMHLISLLLLLFVSLLLLLFLSSSSSSSSLLLSLSFLSFL